MNSGIWQARSLNCVPPRKIVGRDGTAWYAEGELVDTIITTAGGEDAFKLLPLGRYTLTEAPSAGRIRAG